MSFYESQRVELVIAQRQMAIALEIRKQVFQLEQQVLPEREVDPFDALGEGAPKCLHILGYDKDVPVATGRILVPDCRDFYATVGRVAVLFEFRRRGWGRRLMNEFRYLAKSRGYPGIELSAQCQVVPFYLGLGYRITSKIFMDAGIEHQKMRLSF